MATFALNLGSNKTGLTTLKAEYLNAAGATLSNATTGFTELTAGQYLFAGTVPANCVAVRFLNTLDASNPYFTLSVSETTTVPAAGSAGSVAAYLYTRNSLGNIAAGLTFHYQTVGVDSSYEDSWSDTVNDVTSDVTGLVNVTLYIGTHVRYWVGSGRYKTVHITADTDNPLALADVVGG